MKKFLNKVLTKKAMGISNTVKLSDVEYNTYGKFIIGTMMGSMWQMSKKNIKEGDDFVYFDKTFKPDWSKLYERWEDNDRKEWAYFVDGKLVFKYSDDILTVRVVDT